MSSDCVTTRKSLWGQLL